MTPDPIPAGRAAAADPDTTLALLGVVVGAMTQFGSGDPPFGVWDTIIGIVVVLLCWAFSRHVRGGWTRENLAFCTILSLGWIFVVGIAIDISFTMSGHARFNADEQWEADGIIVAGHGIWFRDMFILCFWSALALLLMLVRRRTTLKRAVS